MNSKPLKADKFVLYNVLVLFVLSIVVAFFHQYWLLIPMVVVGLILIDDYQAKKEIDELDNAFDMIYKKLTELDDTI